MERRLTQANIFSIKNNLHSRAGRFLAARVFAPLSSSPPLVPGCAEVSFLPSSSLDDLLDGRFYYFPLGNVLLLSQVLH